MNIVEKSEQPYTMARTLRECTAARLFVGKSKPVTLSDPIMIMTAHPGRMKAIIDVPFERPRGVIELRAQAEYGELVYRIWGYLREEVQQAREQAEVGGKKK